MVEQIDQEIVPQIEKDYLKMQNNKDIRDFLKGD